MTRRPLLAALLFALAQAAGLSAQTLPTDPKIAHPYWFKVYAEGVKHGLLVPTCITFDHKDRLWVGSLGGLIIRLEDKNQDGVADIPAIKFPNNQAAVPSLVGMLFVGSDLWVTYRSGVGVFKDTDKDGEPDPNLLVVLSGIPQSMHEVNQMVLGPDGWIYFSVGSFYNHAADPLPSDPQYNSKYAGMLSAIWRLDPAAANPGATLEVYATGIRNTFDLAFDDKGNLWSQDNGRDDQGLELPLEELNLITRNGFYGFPGDGPGTIPPVATFPAHSSPAALLFYRHQRFPGLAGNIFVVLYRTLPPFNMVGGTDRTRKVARVELTPAGGGFTGKVYDWITDFGLGDPPLDMAESKEGEVFLITHNASFLPDARVLKISHPWLEAQGSAAIGTPLTLRTWAKSGWGAFVLFGLPWPAPIPTPLGKLFIDPFMILPLASGLAGGNDEFLVHLSVPNNPALIGGKLTFQSLVGPVTRLQDLVLTNAVTLTIK